MRLYAPVSAVSTKKDEKMTIFLTSKEAADILKISERTLDNLVISDNPPPFVKVGNQRRFHKEDLIEWARVKKQE